MTAERTCWVQREKEREGGGGGVEPSGEPEPQPQDDVQRPRERNRAYTGRMTKVWMVNTNSGGGKERAHGAGDSGVNDGRVGSVCCVCVRARQREEVGRAKGHRRRVGAGTGKGERG